MPTYIMSDIKGAIDKIIKLLESKTPSAEILNDIRLLLDRDLSKIESMLNRKYLRYFKVESLDTVVYEYVGGYGFYAKIFDAEKIGAIIEFFIKQSGHKEFLIRPKFEKSDSKRSLRCSALWGVRKIVFRPNDHSR